MANQKSANAETKAAEAKAAESKGTEQATAGQKTAESATLPTPALPQVDSEPLLAAHRRNVEAFSSASQIIADSMKAFSKRQSEIVQGHFNLMFGAGEALFKRDGGQVQPAEQIDRAKESYEKALADAKELSEIVTKAQNEAATVISQCVMANLDDMKKVTAKS